MPVFIALFRVLRSAYAYVPEGTQLYKAFCGDQTRDACKQDPNHLKFLGMDLSESARAVTGGFWKALPYFILVGLVVLTGYLQSRQSQRNNPNVTGAAATITKILPIMFGVFSIGFPSGLVLYFLTSNLWRLGQQELIMRKIAPRPGVGGALPAKSTPTPAGGEDGADGGAGTDDGKNGGRTRTGGLLSRLMPAPEPEPPPAETPPSPPTTPADPSSRAGGRSRSRRKKRKRR
jgi:hypothetical protein